MSAILKPPRIPSGRGPPQQPPPLVLSVTITQWGGGARDPSGTQAASHTCPWNSEAGRVEAKRMKATPISVGKAPLQPRRIPPPPSALPGGGGEYPFSIGKSISHSSRAASCVETGVTTPGFNAHADWEGGPRSAARSPLNKQWSRQIGLRVNPERHSVGLSPVVPRA